MKLNIGCGFLKLPGYINIDREPICCPDMCFNLEEPWPMEDNSVDTIVAHHTLEHLGETYTKFLGILKEMYRVSMHGAKWKITVPHWQNDNFYHDPTHVRVITPATIQMFDQTRNVRDFELGGHESKLGLFSGIDIELVDHKYVLSEPWNSQLAEKKITAQDLDFIGRNYNNVCHEISMEVLVHKPQRQEKWIEEYAAQRYTSP